VDSVRLISRMAVQQEEPIVLQETQAPATQTTCCHYWIIQPAEGPVSLGMCQLCLETREFKNSIEWEFENTPKGRDKSNADFDPVPEPED